MSGPVRIQRKRTKGWRMPEGAIYVGRPSKWGNPFVVGAVLTSTNWLDADGWVLDRQHATALYGDWLFGERRLRTGFGPTGPGEPLLSAVDELTGHDLACWCPLDQPCHADVLLEIANGRRP